MDSQNIVRQFQNLRAFSSSKFMRMDELVQDLTNALEESARQLKGQSSRETSHLSAKRQQRRRKGKKRRTFIIDMGNMSEASESSIDEALKDYMENLMQQSDSDDFALTPQVARLTIPENANFVPSVESDSVNENFSPIRPQRRRKKYKSMAVDPDPEGMNLDYRPKYQNKKGTKQTEISLVGDDKCMVMSTSEEGQPGKRKRNAKSKSDYSTVPGSVPNQQYCESDMASGTIVQESSSSLSSSESDGLLTNDEGREADDEQSDLYYEPGPACGIPGIIKWWENDSNEEGNVETDKQFHQILTGSFEHLPKSSQLAFRARVSNIMERSGRQIRFGRRKLMEKVPGYTLSRFLQDRQRWNSMQGILPSGCQSGNSHDNDHKRRKKTPPSSSPTEDCATLHSSGRNTSKVGQDWLTGSEGVRDKQRQRYLRTGIPVVGDNADPIPESNIGNKMLQTMGWVPGTGLGAEGAGIKTPVMTYRRQKRQGLGFSTHPYCRSHDS